MEIQIVAPAGVPLIGVARLSAALVNNTAKSVTLIVPAHVIYRVQAGWIYNADNVARVCTIRVYDGTNTYFTLYTGSLNSSEYGYFPTATLPIKELILDSGWGLQFDWAAGGASAGGTAYYGIWGDKWGKHD